MSEERYLGFDVGGQSVKAALVDARGTVLRSESAPTGPGTDEESLVRTFLALRESLAHDGCAGVGVGIAGVLDSHGTLRGGPHLPELHGKRIEKFVATGMGVPATVRNDADCAAVAEGWIGAAVGRHDYLAITLGTGVGSGLVLGGQLRRGESGYGCEFGHMIVVHQGLRCGCGNRGCLEAYISETATRRAVERAGLEQRLLRGREPEGGIARVLFDAAAGGDAQADAIVDGMIDHLGTALASAVNILDLTTIVVGGGIAPGVLARVERLRAAIAASLFARSVDDVEIVEAAGGPLAGAIGAARLAMLAR
ncbi:MAG TPA: ROK family protein [Candidatus Limnocylindrales bacterium]|nr:ROK family protein [Candidatus Limnocylindrales bacterium]